MHLDPDTVLVATSGCRAVLGFVLLLFWLQDWKFKALSWAGSAFLIGAMSAFLVVGRSLAPHWSYDAGHLAMLVAYGLLWQAMRSFEGRSVEPFAIVLGASIYVLFWIGGGSRSFLLTLSFSLGAIYAALSAAEIWRNRAERLPSRLPICLAFITIAGLMLVRAISPEVFSYSETVLPSAKPNWFAVPALLIFSANICVAVFLIAMAKERIELAHQGYSLIDPQTGALGRAAFMLQAGRAVARHASDRRPVSLVLAELIFDGDVIHDEKERDLSEHVFRRFHDETSKRLRSTDIVGRMGRKEFAYLVPGRSHIEASDMAEQIGREAVASIPAMATMHMVISAGIASSAQVGYDLRSLISAADAALQHARSLGDDRAVAYYPGLGRPGADVNSGPPGRKSGSAKPMVLAFPIAPTKVRPAET